jgi:hypothetical protein
MTFGRMPCKKNAVIRKHLAELRPAKWHLLEQHSSECHSKEWHQYNDFQQNDIEKNALNEITFSKQHSSEWPLLEVYCSDCHFKWLLLTQWHLAEQHSAN